MAVIDGTLGSAAAQAGALDAFLRDGLTGAAVDETVVLYRADDGRERLIELSPTRDVRLVKMAASSPDTAAGVIAEMARAGDVSLLLLAGGAGPELATRIACRCGGAVLTDVLHAQAEAGRLVCRRPVYSNHMTGRFELRARPWCVSIDAGWACAGGPGGAGPDTGKPGEGSTGKPGDRSTGGGLSAGGHRVLSEADETGRTVDRRFRDVELGPPPETGDLAGSRFIVVAGSGAGSREGVARIAAAAARSGADLGVSRPVVMNAWAPMDRLIGVSGTRTAPDLCIVVGASGAAALHWGIERAGLIVAVNTDERAPIVANADVAVLDDGVAVMEELAGMIAKLRR
jgi:electron transfer flavoprotein alpha subunit